VGAAAEGDAEAARVQRAVQQQEEEDSLKFLRLLQYQEGVWEGVTADKLQEQAAALAKEKAEALDQLAGHKAEVQALALKDQEERLAQEHEAALEALRQSERAAHEAERVAESRERLARLAALHENVDALDKAYSYDAEYKQRSHGLHRLCAALGAVEEALRGSRDAKLGPRLLALKAAAPDDPVVCAAIDALPAKVATAERVPTVRELQARFDTVSSQGRIASYVPEGTGIIGQLVGAAVAALAFKEKGLVDATDAAAVFARADFFVAREQLAEAVVELEQLRGLPRTVAQDWMDAAAARCAVEQSVTLLRAHTTTLTCALA